MQIEKNVEYVGKKRDGVSFSPKDISAAASFLEVSFLFSVVIPSVNGIIFKVVSVITHYWVC